MSEVQAPTTRRRHVYTPAGWARGADLIDHRVVGSLATLDRMLQRRPGEHPFPRPARDPSSGHRFWKLDECIAWRKAEDERLAARLVLPEDQQQQREQAA